MLAATVPVSVLVPVASVEAKVDTRTKKVSFSVVGLVIVSNRYWATPGVITAVVRVKYGAPLVVLTIVNPVAAPLWLPIVAEVVLRPVGVTQVSGLGTPAASVQYSNSIDPTVVPLGRAKSNKWFTTPPAIEPPSAAPA